MFSHRSNWNTIENRLTRALAAKRAAGTRIFDLTETNPTRVGLRYPTDIVRAFEDPAMLAYEPLSAGTLFAREAVSAYYKSRGVNVPVEHILLTASTSEAYAYLFKLLCDPHDNILVPQPSYPLFQFLSAVESVSARPYSLSYHGTWGIDLHSIQRALTPRTRAIVLVNPNNPTGSYVKRDELEELTALCAKHEIALISDEVFADYAFTEDPTRVTSLVGMPQCLTFSMSGLSKVAGLPQMKLGWMVLSGPQDLRETAWKKLELIADTFLSVNTPVQCAAARLLSAGETVQRQIRQRTFANLQFARETLAGTAANVLTVEGGWCATIQVPQILNEEQWTLKLLRESDVLVQPGYFYDFEFEAYLVVSLLPQPEIFQKAITRLVKQLPSA